MKLYEWEISHAHSFWERSPMNWICCLTCVERSYCTVEELVEWSSDNSIGAQQWCAVIIRRSDLVLHPARYDLGPRNFVLRTNLIHIRKPWWIELSKNGVI
jgi:hypothetical protein